MGLAKTPSSQPVVPDRVDADDLAVFGELDGGGGNGHVDGLAGPPAAAGVGVPAALTFHFGPPLAAAAWPVLLRVRLRRPARRVQVLAAVVGGFLVAMAALGVGAAAGWLRGPTLIGAGNVPAEEVILAVLAAAWGWRVAERRRRAWFLPPEPSPPGAPPSPAEPGR
jgi:hypothetical protein